MTNCRVSDDDYRCDIYCYGDIHRGFFVQVSSTKNVLVKDIIHSVALKMDLSIYTVEKKPIGLEHDGKSFFNYNKKSCVETLIMLRNCGYHVPQYVIDTLI